MKEKIKKISVLFLMGVLFFSMLTGCQAKEEKGAEPTGQVSEDAKDKTEQPNNENKNSNNTEISTQPKIDIKIAALKGPTAMGMVKLMKEAEGKTTENNYEFLVTGTADEITVGLTKGEIQIAAIPCNLASVLYNKTEGKVRTAAINTLGVLYMLEKGDTINKIEDLKGRIIYTTGKGTTPEYTLNYILRASGLDPEKDVTIEYKTEASEAAAVFLETEGSVVMLPQPYVATVLMQNEGVRMALDVTEEWEKVSEDGSSVITGVVVVNSDFYEQNREAADAFLTEYAASVAYVKEHVEEAAVLIEEIGIAKEAAAKQAIPFCNMVFMTGDEMKEKISGYLSVLFEQNPQSVGGVLPKDDFYIY